MGRLVGYLDFERWLHADVWLGGGLSYGWIHGTVDEALAKRDGIGWQTDVLAGVELPRALRLRLFTQLTLTLPLYYLHDRYESRDSALYVYALEGALGIRL